MKKMILLFVIALVSCTGENELMQKEDSQTAKKAPLANEDINSGVPPKSHLFFENLSQVEVLSASELTKLYREDIQTALPIYADNLKNMWFSLIYEKITLEGTQEEKLFFLNEQINLKDNIANLNNFYPLLSACENEFSKEELKVISENFEAKNSIALDKIHWKNPNDKEKKMALLIYQKRSFDLTLE
jgi:hypothetical protein